MDPVQFVWLMGIGALIGGGIIGAIAYRNLAPTRNAASNLKAELEQARDEMESYKASVNNHFEKTSELVNELTQDYVKVYKHLAEGAQVLGDGREFTHVLEQHQGKVLISVDSEPAMQDTIVSEVPADAPATSEPRDHVVDQQDTSGEKAENAAEAPQTELPEASAQPEEKREPVLDDADAAPQAGPAADAAEPGAGEGGPEDIPSAKSGKHRRADTSAAGDAKKEPAETT